MSTCPRCGAENYINTCVDCGFEQTRDVLSYYTLTRLSDEDLSFFDTTERLIKKCIKQLELLNKHLRRQGKKELDTYERIDELFDELFDEYVSLTESQPKNEYEGMSANELNDLALEYYNGSGEKELDFVKAFELFTMAAEKGNASAMYKLGYMYYWGKGVPQDCARAFEWYEKTAENGNARAMYWLGRMYENGRGVMQNYVRAIEWYKKAAENGDANAMKQLGSMYYYGIGIEHDLQKAEKWKRKAEAARR